VTNASCSSVSRVGDSDAMMITSGASSPTRSSSDRASGAATATSNPSARSESSSASASSWEASSTSMTRSIVDRRMMTRAT
jgi:hypothetical protein